MALSVIPTEGNMNGATPVTIIPAPANASTRHIVSYIRFHNADTASVTVTLRKVTGAGTFQIAKETLLTLESFEFRLPVSLDGTGESITALLGGAHATTAPTYDATYVAET